MADECYHKIFIQFTNPNDKKNFEDFMESQKWQEIVWNYSQDIVIGFNESGNRTKDNKIMYAFDTNRGMVNDALIEMSKRFPFLRIEIIYHCGVGWYRGYLNLYGGVEKRHIYISENNYIRCNSKADYEAFLQDLRKPDSDYIINSPKKNDLYGFGSLYDQVGEIINLSDKTNKYIKIPPIESIGWESAAVYMDIQFQNNNFNEMKSIVSIHTIDESIWD